MRMTIATALLLAALPAAAFAADDHMGVQASTLKWGPPPPGLPPGARVTVVSGNPGGDGPYVVRAKLPTGYKVMPHTHPTDENVTVLSGVFHIAMGDKFDTKKGDALKAGGFVNAQRACSTMPGRPARLKFRSTAWARSRSTTSIRRTILATPKRRRRSRGRTPVMAGKARP